MVKEGAISGRRAVPVKIAGALIGASLLLLISGAIFLQTAPGRSFVAGLIESALSDERSGTVVSVEGLSGNPLSDFKVRSLIVAQDGTQTVVAEDVSMQWRPLPLLTGTLDVESLSARSVKLSDPGDVRERIDAPSDLIPSLPVDLSVDVVSVPSVWLPGGGPSFQLSGRVVLDRASALDLNAELKPAGGQNENIALLVQYGPAQQELVVDLELMTQEDGALAEFVLPSALRGMRADLEGKGPIDTWRGTLDASLGDESVVDLALAIVSQSLEVEGTINPGPLLADSGSTPLAEPIRVDADLAFADSIPQSYTAELSNSALYATISGGLVTDEQLRSPEFLVRLSDPRALGLTPDGWGLGPAELRGEVVQKETGPGIRLALRAEEIVGPDVVIDSITGEGELGVADDGTRLDAAGNLLIGAPLEQARSARWRITLRYDRDQLFIDTLTFDAEIAQLEGEGRVAFTPFDSRFTLDLVVQELAQWSGILDFDVAGGLTASVNGDWSDEGRRIDVGIRAQSLRHDDPLVSGILGSAPSLDIDLKDRVDAEGLGLNVQLDGAALSAALEGTLSGDFSAVDADFSGRLQALPELAGESGLVFEAPVIAKGRLEGQLESPSLVGKVTTESIALGSVAMRNVNLRADLGDIGNAPAGALEAAFLMGGEALAGGAQLTSGPSGLWRLDDLTLKSASVALDGSLASSNAGPVTGEMELVVQQSDIWTGLIGVPVIAQGEASVALEDKAGTQQVTFESVIRDFEVWLPNQRRYQGEVAELSGTLAVADGINMDELIFESRAVTSGDLKLDTISARFSENAGGLDVSAALSGEFVEPLALSLSAKAERAVLTAPNSLNLNELTGTLVGQELQLAAPVRVEFEPGRVTFDDLDLSYSQGRLKAALDYGVERKWIKLTASDLDMGLVSMFAGADDVFGVLDIELELDATAQPNGNLSISLTDLLLGDELRQDPIDISLNAALQDDVLTAEGAIVTAERLNLGATARLPVSLDPSALTVEVDVDEPVDLKVSGQAELDDLWPLAGAYEHVLGGTAGVDFDLSGTIDEPVLAGTFAVQQATYRNLTTGFRMLAQRIDFSLQDGLLNLASTSATDGESGQIRLAGWVRPFAPDGVRADLSADLEKAKLLRLRDVTLTASGSVRYQGEADSESLTGTVAVDEAEVALIDQLPPDLVELDVIEINRPDGLVTLPDQPEGERSQTQVNATIGAKNRIFLRGRGLESEWKGNVLVAGTLAEPRLTGGLELLRGDFQFAGKRFVLEEGTLNFSGGSEIDPQMALTAVYDVETLEAQIRLTGPISKPTLTLSSRPALPEDEILSRIMFGTSKDRLTILQAAQLGAAAASLSGSGGGFDVVGRIRGALALERLEIGTRGESGTSPLIRGGKYLTRNIYVEVGTARDEDDATSASVDAELTKNLTVGTEATSTGTRKLRLRWKWDY